MLLLRFFDICFMVALLMVVAVVIGYLIINGKKGITLYCFIVTIFGIGLIFLSWIGYGLMELSGVTDAAFLYWMDLINFIPWCFISIPGFIFFLSYAGRDFAKPWLKICVGAMLILSLFDFLRFLKIGVFASPGFPVEIGTANLVLSYSALTYAVIIFFRAFVKKYSNQNKLIIFAFVSLALAVILIDSLNNFSILPDGGSHSDGNFIIKSAYMGLILLILAVVTYKYRFLNIIPMAYRNIVSSMDEGVMVVDPHNKVVMVNHALQKYFPECFSKWNGIRLEEVLWRMMSSATHWAEKTTIIHRIIDLNNMHSHGTIQLDLPKERHFDYKIRPVTTTKGRAVGRVITFNEVTHYWELNYELSEKNEELTVMNTQLQEYSVMAAELAATRERNRIARDIHDILGHTLTVLITTLEVCRNKIRPEQGEVSEKLSEAIRIARDGLSEVRNSVIGLVAEEKNQTTLQDLLEKMAHDVQLAGMNIEVAYDASLPKLTPVVSYHIYRVCKESLTNSLRHGKAARADIIIKRTGKGIRVHILDNGIGCKEIKQGHGLDGLQQRVTDIGGKITFYSDGEQGFGVKMEIDLD